MTDQPQAMLVQITSNDQYVLTRSYHDGSAIIAVYGPFPSADVAKTAEQALYTLGLEGDFKVLSLTRVGTQAPPPLDFLGVFRGVAP